LEIERKLQVMLMMLMMWAWKTKDKRRRKHFGVGKKNIYGETPTITALNKYT
jgi:hypothetical protein